VTRPIIPTLTIKLINHQSSQLDRALDKVCVIARVCRRARERQAGARMCSVTKVESRLCPLWPRLRPGLLNARPMSRRGPLSFHESDSRIRRLGRAPRPFSRKKVSSALPLWTSGPPHPNLGEGDALDLRRPIECAANHPVQRRRFPLPQGEGQGEGEDERWRRWRAAAVMSQRTARRASRLQAARLPSSHQLAGRR